MRKFNCHSDPAPILVREKNLWTCSRIIADKLRDPSGRNLDPQDDRERTRDDRKGFGMTSKGFTLAEILVVMAITAIVGTILVAIFTATLRGSSKSQMLSVIKQNGQAVLENMDKTIRNSDKVICTSADNLVVEKDSIYTRYRIQNFSISSNGWIKQDSPIKGATETDPQFAGRVCISVDAMLPQANFLTDTNTQTGVSVVNYSFQLNSSSGYKDQVTVRFDLKPGIAAPAAVAGQIDPVTFQTTVQVRNDRK